MHPLSQGRQGHQGRLSAPLAAALTFDRRLRARWPARPPPRRRVTELLARPILNLHVPSLAAFRQPLAGEIGARREVLEAIASPVGYGIEITMLIDVERRIGLERMAQSDLGTRQNRHQPLGDLTAMALGVPAAADFRVRTVVTEERPPLSGVRPAA